ncbi:YdcH family protein [Novosphingobium album (ex Liu et al. 2023)]|uniref:YdcH family protein n=1 Tax=Novosphingobium album (ex Liu et al. 2023) TaxID=3031130 RepID=A0ABT5WSR9_9SPHN|nr:YdcH family protein [Novosphingobium album (ex Liu et al. 2023)]MDE8652796.1 YdcH family protein [Novosphingobium album (ex Liu et al. 2023)]
MLENIVSSTEYRLTQIHRNLDDAITKEMGTHLPDSLKLLRLKKMRLAVKDRLAALMMRKKAR